MEGQGGGGSAPATIAGNGSYQDRKFAVRAKLGALALLLTADRPYPVDLDVRTGDTRLQVRGDLTEPVKLGGMRVTLMLEGPDMEELWTLLGWPLAPTPRYRLSGELTKKDTTWQLNGLEARIGRSRLSGTVSARFPAKGPPVVDGDLRSSLLDVADLKGFLGQAKRKPKHAAAKAGLLSNSPFQPHQAALGERQPALSRRADQRARPAARRRRLQVADEGRQAGARPTRSRSRKREDRLESDA